MTGNLCVPWLCLEQWEEWVRWEAEGRCKWFEGTRCPCTPGTSGLGAGNGTQDINRAGSSSLLAFPEGKT